MRPTAASQDGKDVVLGLKRGVVELADHDEAWSGVFRAERDRLATALESFDCQIEHVGSTAVAGIPAKPILDIALGFPEQTEQSALRARLESLGYTYRGDSGESGGHVFVRGSDQVRTHHLHAVSLKDKQWANYVAFRDLLRSDAKSREVYTKAKQTLAEKFRSDRKSYTDGKAPTIQQLLLKTNE